MNKLKMMMWALAMALSLGGCSCTQIESGSVGVKSSWGRVDQNHTYPEGMHVTGPGEDLHEMNIRLQAMEIEDVPCRSHDNVSIKVDATVQYSLRAEAAGKVYRKLGDGYADTVVLPAARSAIRDGVATVEALVVAQSREQLETAMLAKVRTSVEATLRRQSLPGVAIEINGIQLRNVELPQSLTASIEAITQQQNRTRQNQMAIETARQEAERRRIEMEGQNAVALLEAQRAADVRRIAGESEASYNRTVSASLTPQLVELRRIEAQRSIATAPNTRLVIMGGGGGGGGGGGSMPVVLQAP